MTDRLRRLNLLFHIRVLGRSDQETMVRGYCSSLGAVWEGVEKTRGESWDIHLSSWAKEYTAGFGDCDALYHRATADHPAEALVLACLRAVGCSEEELA